MSTVSVEVGARETDNRFRRDLLKSTFSLANVSALNLVSRELRRGEEFEVRFTRLLFCTVNVPTLIQLTTNGETIEFSIENSMLLPITGSVIVANPPDNEILTPVEVRYVAI